MTVPRSWLVAPLLLVLAFTAPAHALGAEPTRGDAVGTFKVQPRVLESVNLYRAGALVKQYTNYWCVPATTQSMVNLVRGTTNRTYTTQQYMYKKTRQNNLYTYQSLGNDPQGWAWAVNYFSRGAATYEARAFSDRGAAIREIADSIVRTGHPVGVTVRAGTHAWVVLGFKGDIVPGEPSTRRVSGFYVSGPLGGPTDPWTVGFVSIDAFNKAFTPYHEWQRSVIWEDKFVVISD